MDKLLGKAVGKVFSDDDERPQGGNVTHGGAYPAGGGVSHGDGLDSAAAHAANNAPEDQDFFAGVLGQLLQGKQPAQLAEEDIDEEDAIQSHLKFFSSSSSSSPTPNPNPASASALGSAAAMQALKLFTSSDTNQQQQGQSQSQSEFVGLAMAQASKLFDTQAASQGGVGQGVAKEGVVRQAGEMALKMYLKSYGKGSGGGEGLEGLVGLAGKFLK